MLDEIEVAAAPRNGDGIRDLSQFVEPLEPGAVREVGDAGLLPAAGVGEGRFPFVHKEPSTEPLTRVVDLDQDSSRDGAGCLAGHRRRGGTILEPLCVALERPQKSRIEEPPLV